MADMTETKVRTGNEIGIDDEVNSHIGNQLKAYYDKILAQPVPARFEDLLRQLDGQSASLSGQERS